MFVFGEARTLNRKCAYARLVLTLAPNDISAPCVRTREPCVGLYAMCAKILPIKTVPVVDKRA